MGRKRENIINHRKVQRMREAGRTWKQIAVAMGYRETLAGYICSEHHKWTEAWGEEVAGKTQNREPKEERERMQVVRKEVDAGKIGALYKAGWNSGKIAVEMGIGVERVRYELDKMGLRGDLIGV